jgi:hypothetical protein
VRAVLQCGLSPYAPASCAPSAYLVKSSLAHLCIHARKRVRDSWLTVVRLNGFVVPRCAYGQRPEQLSADACTGLSVWALSLAELLRVRFPCAGLPFVVGCIHNGFGGCSRLRWVHKLNHDNSTCTVHWRSKIGRDDESGACVDGLAKAILRCLQVEVVAGDLARRL